jgi:hypothetical protein
MCTKRFFRIVFLLRYWIFCENGFTNQDVGSYWVLNGYCWSYKDIYESTDGLTGKLEKRKLTDIGFFKFGYSAGIGFSDLVVTWILDYDINQLLLQM